jgi:2'-5' RNA ligase
MRRRAIDKRSAKPHEPTVRLFVAAYPPANVAKELAREASSLCARLNLPDSRETPNDQIHLTLQFVGETPVANLEGVRESVRRAASGLSPFDLWPLRIISLPMSDRPRLIAAETDAPPTLLELHRRLAQRLARTAREKAGDRFTPHLTLRRFALPGFRHARIDEPITLERERVAFQVAWIALMQSDLKPDRAVHTEVERVPLA